MDRELQKSASQISTRLQELEAEYRGVTLGAFLVLEQFDPETAHLAVDTFGKRDNAALWFGNRIGSLCGQTPWEYLARGDVGKVQWVLNAIAHGIPP